MTRLKPTKSTLLLIAGFSATLLITLAALAFISLQINDTQEQINNIVTTNNEKTRLLVQMQQTSRERTLALYKLVHIHRKSAYNKILKKFQNYAETFYAAREKLLTMPQTEQEKVLLKQQNKYSQLAMPLQNLIIKLIDKKRYRDAVSTLNSKSIPMQNRVLAQLEKLINYQYSNNQKITHQLEEQLNKNIAIIIFTAITILVLTIFTSIYVIARINRSEKQLYFEKELAQITLNSIGDGVITIDKDYRIQTINPVAEMLTDTSAKEIIGKSILAFYSDRDKQQGSEFSKKLLHNNKRSLFDITLTRNDGKQHEVEHTIAPIIDPQQDILGAVIILRDVTEMRNMEKRLSYQASHDALTGLINRREFEVRLQQTIRNAQTEKTSHSICFIDLDKFKIINDTSGHAAGDEFLKQISKTIQSQLRHTDVLARLGGDEFAIILDNCSIHQAKIIGSNILKCIRNTRFSWDDNSFEAGASMGIVPINQYTSSVSDVMSSVDAACYEAKDKGRNRIQVFKPNDADFVKHKMETSWIQRIKDAIDNDQFELYFQELKNINPQYPTPKSVEILIRLKEDDEIIPPDSFIPTAERYHLMPIIDEWVINNTFDFLQQYEDRHHSEIRVAINLSGQSLSEDRVLNLITSKLRKNRQLKKELVCFEITETSAIANMSKAVEFITHIKQMGCSFSLDDFGSGLSSFSYLKNMPVDNIKIDGVFIRDIINDPVNRIFVESIHNISKTIGIKTTAEYVENKDILDCVQKIGIDYAQGYHISVPAPVKNLLL